MSPNRRMFLDIWLFVTDLIAVAIAPDWAGHAKATARHGRSLWIPRPWSFASLEHRKGVGLAHRRLRIPTQDPAFPPFQPCQTPWLVVRSAMGMIVHGQGILRIGHKDLHLWIMPFTPWEPFQRHTDTSATYPALKCTTSSTTSSRAPSSSPTWKPTKTLFEP
jgi:hypothetical protein